MGKNTGNLIDPIRSFKIARFLIKPDLAHNPIKLT